VVPRSLGRCNVIGPGRDSLSWPQEDGLRWLHLRGGGVSF